MEWKEILFDDFCRLNRGFDLPNDNIVDGDVPVVASSSIKAFHNVAKVKGPGVVTGRSGTLGIVQYVEQDYWPLNTSLYVKDFKGNSPKFCYYFLRMMHLENFNAGAGVPTLNQNHLHKLKIKVPATYDEQEKVASILSNYDTLIDINTKRINLLEESARELYKEWFVRMRFPGYETTKFVKGIPEGWKVKELKELVSTQYGLTTTAHSEKAINDVYYLRITDIVDNNIDWSNVPYCTADDDLMRKYKLFPGDILVARTGATVGYATQIQNISFDAVFASYLIRLKVKNILHIPYIGMTVVSDMFKDYIQTIATGAAQPMANPHLMTSFKVLLPSETLLWQFNEKIDLINDEILKLQLQNQNLAATRDRLLPSLLSGELKVKA